MEKKGQEDGRLILKPIAKIFTDFPTKFGIPRQSGLGGKLEGEIVFEPEYRNPDAVRGLEEYSHIWLIWEFSGSVRSGWSATVRPPRLGGNTRVGVFATRSPFRPNPLGLSSVQLEEILYTKERGPVLKVRGVDMMNGTPVYDIKPRRNFCPGSQKKSGRAFSPFFPRIPGRPIKRTRSGSMGWSLRTGRSGFGCGNRCLRYAGFTRAKMALRLKGNKLKVKGLSGVRFYFVL